MAATPPPPPSHQTSSGAGLAGLLTGLRTQTGLASLWQGKTCGLREPFPPFSAGVEKVQLRNKCDVDYVLLSVFVVQGLVGFP